jgi:hypothetical protein
MKNPESYPLSTILSSEGVRGGSGVFRKSKDRKRFLANYLEVLTAHAQLSVSAMVRNLRHKRRVYVVLYL